MSLQEEITKAIGAHGVWKMRLRNAIDSGKADANAADVAKDNVCPFGQWLYGAAMPASVRSSADYASVRKLHADFHKCAAKVIECVGQGDSRHADGRRLRQDFRRSHHRDDEVEGGSAVI